MVQHGSMSRLEFLIPEMTDVSGLSASDASSSANHTSRVQNKPAIGYADAS